MRITLLILIVFSFSKLFAQDHFTGINMSNRVGVLNANLNPATLANLNLKYNVNVLSISTNVSNNKVGFNDIVNGDDIEDLLFVGDEPANSRVDAEIYGPGFAMKLNKWSFGINTKANLKLSLVDVNPTLGNAINQNILNINGGSSTLINNYNQRINGITWGELGFTAARNIFENENHKFNAGITLKLLFPGSFANFGIDSFSGTIVNNLGQINMVNSTANINIAYSGNLGENLTDFGDYTQSVYGNLNGLAGDIGVNYQWKDQSKNGYILNAGIALRNIGGMTFKSENNAATNYNLSIQGSQFLNLDQFTNLESLTEIETKLLESGFLDKSVKNNAKFKVNLPTVFSLFADVKIVSKFYVSFYTQQKMKNNSDNDQITIQNVLSLTPRIAFNNYEIYSSWSKNEISGITGGIGFRIFGFYLGSSSIITAISNNTKQADLYLGYQFGL